LIRQTHSGTEENKGKPGANIETKFGTRVGITDRTFGVEKIAVKPGAIIVKIGAMRDRITGATLVAV